MKRRTTRMASVSVTGALYARLTARAEERRTARSTLLEEALDGEWFGTVASARAGMAKARAAARERIVSRSQLTTRWPELEVPALLVDILDDECKRRGIDSKHERRRLFEHAIVAAIGASS